jgi:hypothetical protein
MGRRRGRSRHPVFPFKAKIVAEGDYGPTNGAQSVRDGAVPNAVTVPGAAHTTFTSAQSMATIQAAVTAAGTGAVFWFTKGAYTWNSTLVPLANQKFYFESAAGLSRTAADTAVLDAGGANLSLCMFGSTATASLGGVQVYGGKWQNHSTMVVTAGAIAAITNMSYPPSVGWIVQDTEITNAWMGIRFGGNNFVGRRNYIHDCGFYPMNSVALSSNRHQGALIENNRWINNCVVPGSSDPGQKWVHVDGMTFRNNYIEGSQGAGVWWDFQHKNHIIHDNVIENCTGWGLFYEWSNGGTEIYNNALFNNAEGGGVNWFGDVQLLVSSCDATLQTSGATLLSSTILVHHNLLDGTAHQMGVVELTGRPHPNGARFYENDVWWRGTLTTQEIAGGESGESRDVYIAGRNTFEANHYHVPNLASGNHRWQWLGAEAGTGASGNGGNTKTWAEWQAYGHDDPGGTLVQI